jgi:hypothetical protein
MPILSWKDPKVSISVQQLWAVPKHRKSLLMMLPTKVLTKVPKMVPTSHNEGVDDEGVEDAGAHNEGVQDEGVEEDITSSDLTDDSDSEPGFCVNKDIADDSNSGLECKRLRMGGSKMAKVEKPKSPKKPWKTKLGGLVARKRKVSQRRQMKPNSKSRVTSTYVSQRAMLSRTLRMLDFHLCDRITKSSEPLPTIMLGTYSLISRDGPAKAGKTTRSSLKKSWLS